jgi:hypothetical protein
MPDLLNFGDVFTASLMTEWMNVAPREERLHEMQRRVERKHGRSPGIG